MTGGFTNVKSTKIMKNFYIFLLLSLCCGGSMMAQSAFDSEADSINCTQNYNQFSDNFEGGNTAEAMRYWRACFGTCPKVSKNVYINGAKLVEGAIKSESDKRRKEQLIDTLFLLYDRRVENFGEEGKVLGYKAEDLAKYRPAQSDKTYEMIRKSIKLEGNNSRGKVLSLYVQMTLDKVKKQQAEKTDLAEAYGVASEIIDINLAKEPGDKFYANAQKAVEEIYTKEINLDCQGITELFRSKFEDNQTNIEFLTRLKTLLEKKSCKDGDMYLLTIQNLVANDPTSESLEKMAEYHQGRKEMTKAVEYYKKAIAKETDKTKKASLYYKLAETTSINPTLSVMYCNSAVQIAPSFAKPYLLIAKHYATGSSRCGKDSKYPEFLKKTMYWAAVDKLEVAKSLDPSLAEEANKLILEYSARFPTLEEVTFQGLQVGSSYNIDCWIQSTTTVRIAQAK